MYGLTCKWNILFLLLGMFVVESGTAADGELLPMALAERLMNLLRPLSEISLCLRTTKDASNPIVQFFLMQAECPVKVFLGSVEDSHENRNNVVLTEIDTLEERVEQYSSRLGVQFFILESPLDHNETVKISQSIWNRLGIYKNYFLAVDEVYFYNPVLPAAPGLYGGLQVAKGYGDFDDVFEDLNGYPVRTYIFRSVYAGVLYDLVTNEVLYAVGADAQVAYVIEKAINCTLSLQHPDKDFFGHRLENGSFDGALGRAIRYETDLILTGFFLKDYLTRDIDFSPTIYMDKLCCFVSKAKRIPQSILPLFSLNKDMWLGFIGTAFIWALIWSLIRICNLWIRKNRITEVCQYMRILVDTWVVWVRVNICRYPPFFSEKIFVVSLALVSVIFGAIFESSLATVYINPLYYKDINTLQELDDTQFKILIKHAAMKDDLFYGSSSPVFKRLDNKLLYVHEMEDKIIEIMAQRGGISSVTREASLFIDDINYILTKRIHKIPECPKTYHIGYILPKGSPFKEKIDKLLLRLLNAGLIDYWIEMMYHEARLSVIRSPEIPEFMGANRWKILTIDDLQLSFYVVIMGGIVSALVLLIELCVASRLRWGLGRNRNE